ncbi:GATOR complex protein WDR59 [Trichonephila inaurata madagascariensis]|uniref:GATOR complex protein WDR59 n=1 Tax=Trichonephila inaurata madagascariensis TaxID=2747483 RepID=A0A8X6YAS9_9ARAC|nr:GATOR complex protein WDR59 [Trichonephila inaurata madagascariensis]
MSTIWGSENVVADHRELQASTMAVDRSGQFAVLAGRRYMGIVHLDQPSEVIHKTQRHSKWEVGTAEWSPLQVQNFALACNQRAELYSWDEGEVKQTASLKAHTRAISDLNWSAFDNHILATASIDTYIYLWDTRDSRKPSISLSAVAGASQVKFNKLQSHLLATSHEGDIRLWDIRKGTSPVQYITAHLNKIHNIDWCPYEENILATSSQDCTVKFWDVTIPQKLEENLQVPCPVWRAQYTPFGYGLLTVVVPPLRRGDNSLLLFNMKNCSTPVHTFFGHSDVVIEFGWRKPSEDSKDYQLVTFAKDFHLRTWVVDSQLQKACGHITNDEETTDIFLDSQDIASQTSVTSNRETETLVPSSPEKSVKSKDKNGEERPVPTALVQPQNLQQEFSLVNLNIPNLAISEMDATKRFCTVSVRSVKYHVVLKLLFPANYPYNNSPSFQFCKGTNIDDEMKSKLLKVLKMVSHQQVRRNRTCLEPCLRQVVSTLDSLTNEDNQPQMPESPIHADPAKQVFNPLSHYGFQDVSVPFPRTSGARFCGADLLVVFTRPSHLQRINAPTDDTPRSLSALSAYLASHVVLPLKGRTASSSPAQYNLIYPPLAQSPSGDASVSISSFYHQDRKQRKRRSLQDRRSSGTKQPSNSGAVLIYSISKLIPVNFTLAQNYVFGSEDIVATCSKNAAIAAKEGCRDLVQVWSLASLICNPASMSTSDLESAALWANHPFGRKTLQSLIFHYGNHYDVQTAAMLACCFHVKSPENKKKIMDINSSGNMSPGGSPYHTVVPANNTFEGWSIVGAALKRNRSNSWSDSVEEYSFFDDHTNRNGNGDFREEEKDDLETHSKLLDPNHAAQFDQYKMVYADILYRWGLLEQRAQVLKTVSVSPEKHKGVEFINECHYCKRDVTGAQCQFCKKFSFSCVICCVAVKGCSSFCMSCGHGGHTTHMQNWFSDMDVCPSGCGCNCLEKSDIFGI